VLHRWITASIAIIILFGVIFLPTASYLLVAINILLAGGLLFSAWSTPAHNGQAPVWLLWFFLPLLSYIFLQACPFGFYHPILHPDITALGYQPTSLSWSVDALRSWEMFTWLTTLLAWGLFLSRALHYSFSSENIAYGLVLALAGAALVIIAYEKLHVTPTAHQFVKGPFAYHNHAGAVWAMVLPLALYFAQRSGSWTWLFPLILTSALVLSASRTAIGLGLGLSLGYLLFVTHGKRRIVITALMGIGCLGVLFFIGTGFAGKRFADLANGQAETINGRTLIWEKITPLLSEAGFFGFGAGTTPVVMQRAAGIDVTGKIDHVHSEPLELLLDFGVIGFSVIIVSILLALGLYIRQARKKSLATPEKDQRHFSVAIGLGLLIVFLHSCTDYILRSGAVNVVIMTLCFLFLTRWRNAHIAPPSRRWPAIILAVTLLIMAILHGFIQRERSLTNTNYATTEEPHVIFTADYAAAQAIAALATPEKDRAEPWLAKAAERSLSSLATWHAYGDIALHRNNISAALIAAERLMAWAPDRDAAQQFSFSVLAQAKQTPSLLESNIAKDIARKLLLDARERTLAEWELLAYYVSEKELLALLHDHHSVITRRSALAWVRKYAELSQWENFRAALPFLYPLDPIQVPVLNDTQDKRTYSVALYDEKEKRRTQAERCVQAGFPFAAELAEALAQDGQSGATYLALAAYRANQTTPTLMPMLTQQLHYPWAKYWWDRLRDEENAVRNNFSSVQEFSHPPIIWAALQHAQRNSLRDQQYKYQRWLSPYHAPHWHDVGWGIRWTWLWVNEQTAAISLPDGWTGIYVDQVWRGWHKDRIPFDHFQAGQLHHVVVVDPP
jgi:O-antigen ligase